PLPIAESLAGRPGQPDSVLVRTERGAKNGELAARVQTAAGSGAVVGSPREALNEAHEEAQIFQQGSLLIVVLSLIVGGFLVFNTVSMAALERRRELATLRALGARRRAVAAVVLTEALAVGVIGSVRGAAPAAGRRHRRLGPVGPGLPDLRARQELAGHCRLLAHDRRLHRRHGRRHGSARVVGRRRGGPPGWRGPPRRGRPRAFAPSH